MRLGFIKNIVEIIVKFLSVWQSCEVVWRERKMALLKGDIELGLRHCTSLSCTDMVSKVSFQLHFLFHKYIRYGFV